MEFIGSAHNNTIPVPNMTMSPEMLTQNYPLNFLLQPIIPLLAPPTVEEAAFSVTIPPCIGETWLGLQSKRLEMPSLWTVGAGVAVLGLAYAAWRVSRRWDVEEDPDNDQSPGVDTVFLDEEVEKIMSGLHRVRPLSVTCSSVGDVRELGPLESVSITKSVSQSRLCSCVDLDAPIKQLQSRVDQVMSRVESVISGMKALESRINLADEDGEIGGVSMKGCDTVTLRTGATAVAAMDNTTTTTKELLVVRPKWVEPVATQTSEGHPRQSRQRERTLKNDIRCCLTPKQCQNASGPGFKERGLDDIHKLIKEMETRVDSISTDPTPKHSDRRDHKNTYTSSASSWCSDKWDRSNSFVILSNETEDTSLQYMPLLMSSLSPTSRMSRQYSLSAGSRTSPGRNQKRHIRSSLSSVMKLSPTIEEDPLISSTDNLDGIKTASEKAKRGSPPTDSGSSCTTKGTMKQLCENSAGQSSLCVNMRRQDTWPVFRKEPIAFPQINPLTSNFKPSEKTRFQVLEPSISNATMAGVPALPYSTLVSKPPEQPVADKDEEGTRGRDTVTPPDKDDWPEETTDLSKIRFGREPVKSSPKVYTKSPKTKTIKKKKAAEVIVISKQSSQSGDSGDQKVANTNTPDVNHDDTAEINGQKHKLKPCPIDSPPVKVSCRCHFEEPLVSAIGSPGDNAYPDSKCATAKITAVNPRSEKLGMSSFRKLVRRKNEYQVKYVSKGKSDGEEGAPSNITGERGGREEEWIVIVPRKE